MSVCGDLAGVWQLKRGPGSWHQELPESPVPTAWSSAGSQEPACSRCTPVPLGRGRVCRAGPGLTLPRDRRCRRSGVALTNLPRGPGTLLRFPSGLFGVLGFLVFCF